MSEQYPIELKETVLLNFTAKWCGYCKKMNKILDQYDLGNISLVSIDFDKQKSFGRAPAVLANLIALGVSYYMITGKLYLVGIPLALLAGATLISSALGYSE